MIINSKEYWNYRFETDWLDYAGDKQTAFFAKLLCDMLPSSLIKEIMTEEYTVCDMGCAMGEGIPIFSRKLGVDVDGMDFSAEAIGKAKTLYPQSNFHVGDLLNLDSTIRYDVVICSNVLEHFSNPWKIFRNLTSIINKYIIILVPYKEKLDISEHVYQFSEDVIPTQLSGFTLNYVRTIDGKEFSDTYYPDQQILLIYKKENNTIQMLSDLSTGITESLQREYQNILNQNNEQTAQIINQQKAQFDEQERNYNSIINQYKCDILTLNNKIKSLETELNDQEQLKAYISEIEAKNAAFSNKALQDQKQLDTALSELELCKSTIQNLTLQLRDNDARFSNELSRLTLENQNLRKEMQDLIDADSIKDGENTKNENSIKESEKKIQELICELQNKENALLTVESSIYKAKANCNRINSKLSYKFLCLIIRFCHQFLMGTREEKKKFLAICKCFLKRQPDTFSRNDGYNMVLNISNMLELPTHSSTVALPSISESASQTADKNCRDNAEIILPNSISNITAECLDKKYDKPDIIIFSVIDYDFRYQRPQHFASRFAQNGHRVFYINANFINKDNIREISSNLNTVDFFCKSCNAIYFASECPEFLDWFTKKMDSLINIYAIRDAMIILDYPNWIQGAQYLRTKYGFKIIVDYMDDFTGFLGTTSEQLKNNCLHMLKNSDQIIASSQFLYDIATQYTEHVSIVRNGTEVEHFYQAALNKEKKQRPVIGYYGAVSHWFSWEKVCHLAANRPDCDIVIIGEVTEHRDKLEKFANIKLLGEKNYKELPQHLAYFDVCLIPFDTSTDLIKATNPVKFYEYLSAGKKIVATEIPELAPFRDKFVYMSNDNNTFLEYVNLCLSGQDSLKSEEESISFARENDWQKRFESFASVCMQAVPKVSIVVLTYNNLELNKACINSILFKTAYPNYELIILDNMSSDGTIDYLHKIEDLKNEKIKIIFNGKNSGFAGGNNLAIAAATGKYVLLLNNDTLVTRGWITNLVKHMENDESCGMCGAVTNSIGNEAMIPVNYKNCKELDHFAYLYTNSHINEIYTDVDRLAMFCTLIRKSIIKEHGFLDEGYQVGMFEDDDYAKVIEKAGYCFYVAEDVFIHHVNNASFNKLEAKEYQKIFIKNKEYFEKKWNTKWRMPKYRNGVTSNVNMEMMSNPK